jgi:preprotein translocase subunit SecE
MAEELEQVSEDLVEKAKKDRAKSRGIGRFFLFFKQVFQELKKVTRPTLAELRNYTAVVLGFVTVVMVIISLLDWGISQLVIFAFTPTA